MRDQSGSRALLRFLVRAGVLANDIADQAESQLAGGTDESAIDWLVRKGITSEHAVAEALAKGLQQGFVDLAAVALDPTVTALIREEVAQHHQIIPLRTRDRTLVIAMANPLDREALREVEFATGRRVQILVATQTAVRDAVEVRYRYRNCAGCTADHLRALPSGGQPREKTIRRGRFGALHRAERPARVGGQHLRGERGGVRLDLPCVAASIRERGVSR